MKNKASIFKWLNLSIIAYFIILSFPLWAKPIDLDSCQIYLQQSKTYATSNQPKDALKKAEQALFWFKKFQSQASDSLQIAVYHQLGKALMPSGEYFKALQWQQQAAAITQKTYGENHLETAKIYMSLSECYWRLSELSKGLEYAQRAYQIFQVLEKTEEPLYAEIVAKLADAYINLEDYSQAIIFYKKSLQLLKNKTGFQALEAAPAYYNIGNAYLGKKQPDVALPYFFKAMKLDEASGADFYVADDLDNIALAFQQKKEYNQAIKYYDRALDLYYKTVGLEHDYTAHAIKFKGECYLEMGQLEKAIEHLQLALRLKEKLLGRYTKDVAICQAILGKAYAEYGDFCMANEAFMEAQTSLKFNSKQPDFEQVISPFTLLQNLHIQAETCLNQYHKNCEFNYLTAATQTYDIAIRLMDDLRSNYDEKDSKLDVARLFKQVLEEAIHAEYQTYLQTHQDEHLRTIFTCIEKSKGLILLENLNKSQAQAWANLPQEIQQQAEDLNIQLAFLEQQQFEEQEKSTKADPDFLSNLHGKIFDVKQAQKLLEQQINQDYPEYAQKIKTPETITLTETQQQVLQPQQTMIQYFIGEKSAFALLVKKDQVKVVPLADGFNYRYWINLYRDNLYRFYEEMSIKKTDRLAMMALQRSNWAAWKLYQHLLLPLETHGLNENIVIIPDGLLAELPFDALLKTMPAHTASFKQYDFLIKHHQIAYAHSVNVLKMMQEKVHAPARFDLIAFAPSFENNTNNPFALASTNFIYGQLETEANDYSSLTDDRNNLNDLIYNLPEAQAIHNMFGGKLFAKEAATEAQFLATAEEANIIHLSTHGKANDTIGDFSFLAFTEIPDDNENEFLYVKDLYHLKLKAAMVVLSACETGIGELQEGEGLLSLANGFAQAGAKSVITTLWSVQDEQTQHLMVDFYQHLKQGQTKGEALRQAKLKQLEKGLNVYAHPFYWAAFVGFGDMSAIRSPLSFW